MWHSILAYPLPFSVGTGLLQKRFSMELFSVAFAIAGIP
jgi:hypothetical protein